MWEKVDVPCVGGPVDGRSLLVPIDEAGVPPDVIDQNWLWVEFGGELLDADMAGVYELEPLAGAGPPCCWLKPKRSRLAAVRQPKRWTLNTPPSRAQ
jgi:hypothetical protein